MINFLLGAAFATAIAMTWRAILNWVTSEIHLPGIDADE